MLVDVVVSVNVKVDPFTVAGAIASLKVADTTLDVPTPEAPFAGVVAVMVGGVVSPGPPPPIGIALWT